MSLNQSQAQMRDGVRKFANIQGTTALLRHPDADISDYINRALGSLHRKLTTSLPDQRFLASSSFDTEGGESTYDLPATFDYLISAELSNGSTRTWLSSFEMQERAMLLSPDEPTRGIPITYRLRGGSIELLPTPRSDDHTVTLWYVPTADQLSSGSEVFDTISRLDEYVIAYSARPVAIKDKNWDLVAACKNIIDELTADIEVLSRNRDRNSPPRVIDVYTPTRWGRVRRFR